MAINVSGREGSFKPWWNSYRIEVVGAKTLQAERGTSEKTTLGAAVTVSDTAKPMHIVLH